MKPHAMPLRYAGALLLTLLASRTLASGEQLAVIAGVPSGQGHLDSLGTHARFYSPTGIAVDANGNLYVADMANAVVRMIESVGWVRTVAGTPGRRGDRDGVDQYAQFFNPKGVAVDGAGNIYVADTQSCTIRKIAAGVVTTFAGAAGQAGSTDGSGSTARFNNPVGLAVDGEGNLYVADSANHTIRKVTPAGAVTTVAGVAGVSGSFDGDARMSLFKYPNGVAVDGSGNVYVADTWNHTIRKIDTHNLVTTLAGTAGALGHNIDGTGASARFYYPASLTVDGAGNVYVADGSQAIRKVTAAGVVNTFAGSFQNGQSGSVDGVGTTARFFAITAVAVDGSGNVYVADQSDNIIRKVTPGAVVTTIAGSAGRLGWSDGTGATAQFNTPLGVAVDAAGNAYLADSANHVIRRVTPTGVTTLAGTAGQYGSADGTGAAARFNVPSGVAVDASGNVYVADTTNNTVRKVTPAGVVTTVAGAAGQAGSIDGTGTAARFYHPYGVAVDGAGKVYVADQYNNTIRIIAPTGVSTLAGTAGQCGYTDGTGSAARFCRPSGVAVDGAGNLYVSDQAYHTVRKVTAGGVVTTLAGAAGGWGAVDGTGSIARFNTPSAVAVDVSGNAYVADTVNNAIRKVTPAGVVTTVVGLLSANTSANLPGALPASLAFPQGVAIGPTGAIYTTVADALLVTAAAAPTFSPGAGAYTTTLSVTLSDTTATAKIYYTTDGTTPTTGSKLYSSAIAVTTTTTIKAIATATGYSSSPVASATYTITAPAATPSFSVWPGAYTTTQSVTISDSTPGAQIYYTTNGTTPTTASTLYTVPVTVASNTTLQAIATGAGYSASSTASATYFIMPPAATPTFSVPSGTYTTPQLVTIYESIPGPQIYYTTDGSTPTTGSTPYSGPVTIASTTKLNAIATGANYSSSSIASAFYTFPAATPTFSVPSGTYTTTQSVTISDETPGARIYYTTNGTTPIPGFSPYSGPVTVGSSCTLQAIAVVTGGPSSPIASATYTITPPAATPTFWVPSGTYTTTQAVTISDSTPGTQIYYTTNGSTPTTGSTLYSGPVTVASTTTLQAIATGGGYSSSPTASATYTITPGAAMPTFSVPAGTYATAQTVTISDSSPGVQIYYTTNLTFPNTSSTLYTGPVTIARTSTLQAIAEGAGYSTSSTASATYTIAPPAATPTFSLAGGTYTTTQTVTISTSTPGAQIYYTTNGTAPAYPLTYYTGPVTIASNTTLKAIAMATGYSSSPVASATYTITPPAATPSFNVTGGTYTTTQTVTISDSTPGAQIYYTANGTTPTSSSTLYNGPVTVPTSTTLQAIAMATGYSSSPIASATYAITPPAATPSFNVAGGTYTTTQTVTISDSTPGAQIYFTTNGTTPTTGSTPYSGPVTVASTSTLQAIATAIGYSSSAIATATYTITPPAATPTFWVASGTYTTTQTVMISDSTPGAQIYYTTNGSTPTTASTLYSLPVTVASTTTLQAIATGGGYSSSPTASATYTITPPAVCPPGTTNACCQGGAPAADGASCPAMDVCRTDGACLAGVCQPGAPLSVDDGNPCTDDQCSPATGVTHLPLNPGASCGTGNICMAAKYCDGVGTCLDGVPAPVDDGNPCTIDSCDPVLGVGHAPAPLGTSCGSSDACSGPLTCDANERCRAGAPPQIDDGNPCTIDTCNPVLGVMHTPSSPGTSCSDGNVCNGEETCNGHGTCVAGVPPNSDDGDPCTADACFVGLGVTHSPIYGCGPAACTPTLGALYRYDPTGNLTEVISTASDPHHCGCASNACPDSPDGPAACGDGICGVSSGGTFVDTSSDVNNCGRVNHVCPPPAYGAAACRNGVCHATCLAGYVEVGNACVTLASDPWNCGWVGNVCPGAAAGTATCEAGWCSTTEVPVVYSVNGLGTGEVFRSPYWQGVNLTGTGLSGVTRIVFEDWGDDTVDGSPTGEQTIPLYQGHWNWDKDEWDDRMLFPTTATTLTIPELALTAVGNSPASGVWYRLRLYYGSADPVTGIQPSLLVDVAVSFDWIEQTSPPTITGVSAIQELQAFYDTFSGFVAIENSWPSVPGQWSEKGSAPTAILGADLLSTEIPILSITPSGVYIRAGFPPMPNYGYASKVVQRMHGEMPAAVFVFPFRNAPGDRVHLGDAYSDGSWVRDLRGGVLLRGSSMYDSTSDATVRLERPLGSAVPGLADSDTDNPLTCFKPSSMGGCRGRYPFHGDRTIVWHFVGAEDSSAYVTYASPYGAASTPWPLKFVNPPVVTGSSSTFVTYDQVMTLTGRFFIDVTGVTFSAYGMETLAPASTSPPGDGQYFVVDDKHLQVRLSSRGSSPPRGLAFGCEFPGDGLEPGAGERILTVTNTDGSGAGALLAVDPQLPRPPAPKIFCPISGKGGGSSAGASSPSAPSTGTDRTPLIPQVPHGNCADNSICVP